MILLIDNYDSFTYNLYQFIGIFNNDIKVVRNDKITIEEIEQLNPESIVISPGPKSPKEAGISVEAIKYFAGKKPILGICLGHQSIGEAFGATVSYAKKLMHGKQSDVTHNGKSIFEGIPSPVKVARYHSLAVIEDTLPDVLEVIARTADGEIMAVKHKEYPVVGLQFHPESILTPDGEALLRNFLSLPAGSREKRRIK